MNHQVRLPEIKVAGKPLGRHVNWDPRSRRFLVGQPSGALRTVLYQRTVPAFDQGDIGSCVGNATIGLCATEPLLSALPKGHAALDEVLAQKAYSLATTYDDITGTWRPDDTGSDGLSGAKAAKTLGFSSGYLHATNLQAMQNAMQTTSVMIGISWHEAMDRPASDGLVSIKGAVRGGHEVQAIGMDVDTKEFLCVNSLGPDWGFNGRFKIKFGDMDELLHDQGDCTQLLPLTAPPPQPGPATDKNLVTWWANTNGWAHARHVGTNAAAARAALALAEAEGLA